MPKNIERDELLRRTPSQQIVKLRPAIGTHMNDLAIENGGCKRLSESRTELCKRFVDVPFPRYQLHVAIVHVGQRPEPVIFQFKQPIGMVKRHVQTRQRHMRETGKHLTLILTVRFHAVFLRNHS